MTERDLATIRSAVPLPALYELLAEECTELAHAALKAARRLRAENPTPLTFGECRHMAQEEISDVHLVARVLGLKPDPEMVRHKLERWYERLEGHDRAGDP